MKSEKYLTQKLIYGGGNIRYQIIIFASMFNLEKKIHVKKMIRFQFPYKEFNP